ncbi:hypothetical protein AB8B21_10775 [Tardiphaga sp. 866_E4_N2_1]|uniref:hypothetical protein n=1 Tax=unclassified Tardiphaga TaxID=2631404 RepID=UPI003F1F78F4
MTLNIQLTAASSNLATYLASYDANFTYNGNGWFSTSFTGQDQWSPVSIPKAPTTICLPSS